jgi:hypothetical protein
MDLLEMAKQGVVKIPPPMIDGETKSILGTHTLFQVTALPARADLLLVVA